MIEINRDLQCKQTPNKAKQPAGNLKCWVRMLLNKMLPLKNPFLIIILLTMKMSLKAHGCRDFFCMSQIDLLQSRIAVTLFIRTECKNELRIN